MKNLMFILFEIPFATFLCSIIQYPEDILDLKYLPGFAIRGLHYDIEKGLLLKLDSFLQIQLGSVYRGLTPVSNAEVIRLYRNKNVPLGLSIVCVFICFF